MRPKLNSLSRNRRRSKSRKLRIGKSKLKRFPQGDSSPLQTAVKELLIWCRQGDLLAASVTGAFNRQDRSKTFVNAASFVAELQSRRRLFEELYCWAHEAYTKSGECPESRESVEEGIAIVDGLFEELKCSFGLEIIQDVDELIPSPSPRNKKYKYSRKYNPGLSQSRVLFPGLRQGDTVISPAEVDQVSC